ncbi:WhiB family transcriptional regulator [Nocardia puris]|uniref:Transcriptional regulator WhiB n=1 Tax=Nocardia puris TaxID=208602 RepID=A0A366DDQ8_9NOCA|nr:WhiB family transcriptional regulator [Nocardia puris]RBO87554.1 transcription factor WhiB [Nocardia puris]
MTIPDLDTELARPAELDPRFAAAADRWVTRLAATDPDPTAARREVRAMLGLDGAPMRTVRTGNRSWPSDLGKQAGKAKPEPASPEESARRLASDPDWRTKARCHGADGELWFPFSENDDAESARRMCFKCPVIENCAAHALVTGVTTGIWAGHRMEVVAERDALRKKFGLEPAGLTHMCGTCGDEFRTSASVRSVRICPSCRTDRVAPDAVRDHIALLRSAGWTLGEIAATVGLDAAALKAIVYGSTKTVPRALVAKMLAIPVTESLGGVREHIALLVRAGASHTAIALELDASVQAVASLASHPGRGRSPLIDRIYQLTPEWAATQQHDAVLRALVEEGRAHLLALRDRGWKLKQVIARTQCTRTQIELVSRGVVPGVRAATVAAIKAIGLDEVAP